ncbi:MAG: hypothetical protein IPK78_01085 [Rhodospirillales bacterium]|nr:hypothetical protein [Rhodospirillales bacterium]
MSSHGGNQASGQAAFADTWANASPSAAMPIPDLLRGMEAIVVGVIGRDGELKDANRGFLLLMTRSSTTPQPADIRDLFVSPRFEDFASRRADPFEGTIYRGLISFGRAGIKVTSLRGTVYGYEHEFILVAEHDIIGVETLRVTLLELQDSLAEKQRQIVHLEHQLGRLQELADAAMRDRDTLLDALAHGGPSAGD